MQSDEPVESNSGEVNDLTATTPPPPMAAYPRPQAQATDANSDPLRFVIPVNPSVWAVAAGYLGLFSVLCVFGPFALFAGIMGLRDIKNNPGKTGKGRAWFGIVMGAVGTGFLAFGLIQWLAYSK